MHEVKKEDALVYILMRTGTSVLRSFILYLEAWMISWTRYLDLIGLVTPTSGLQLYQSS